MKANEFVSEGFFDKLATGTKKFLDRKQQSLYDRVKQQFPDADETTIQTIVKGLGDPSTMAKINDPQVLKKAELMKKQGISSAELAAKVKQRAERKPIEKSIQRQKQKLRKQGIQQPTTQKVNTPPIGAVIPNKDYGDLVFKGNMWTSRDGRLTFSSPDAIKKLNTSYLQAKQAGAI